MSRFAIFFAAALAACSSATQPTPTVTGTYQLTTFNGASLPAQVPGGLSGVPATATAGSIVLTDEATVFAHMVMTIQADGKTIPVPQSLAGSYTLSGDTVFIRDAARGDVIPALVRNGILTASFEGVPLQFARR